MREGVEQITSNKSHAFILLLFFFFEEIAPLPLKQMMMFYVTIT